MGVGVRAGEKAHGKIYFSFNGNVFSFHSEVEERRRYAVHKALENEGKIQNAEEMCLYFNHVDRFLRSPAGRELQASPK